MRASTEPEPANGAGSTATLDTPRSRAEARAAEVAAAAKADPWLLWVMGRFWVEHDRHFAAVPVGPWEPVTNIHEGRWGSVGAYACLHSTGEQAGRVWRFGQQRKWRARVSGSALSSTFDTVEAAKAAVEGRLERRYGSNLVMLREEA